MMRRAAVAASLAVAAALVSPPIAGAHHPPLDPDDLASAWDYSPFVLASAGLAIVLFVQAMVRLRRRGRTDHAPLSRALLFGAGLAITVLALISPLDAIGEQFLLSAHMLQHVSVADAGPALLLVAVRGPLVFFLIPAAVLGPLAHFRPLRTLVTWLTYPETALVLWMTAIAAWHVPGLYQAALDNRALHNLEHASFIVVGVLIWTVLIDPTRRARVRRAGRIATAVVVFAAGQILAEILLFSGRPLYGAYAAQNERLLGLSPLTDQRLAGAAMMVEQAVTIGLFLLIFFLAEDQAARRRAAVEEQGTPARLRP